MSTNDRDSLESEIIETFLETIGASDDISAEVVDIIDDLTEESDFGGREQLQERVREVKGLDAD